MPVFRQTSARPGVRRAAWPHAAAIVLVIGAAAAMLFVMGRTPVCRCGTVKLWHGVIFSAENSQHLIDPYTFTHVVHGFLFYGLFWLAGPRWPLGARMLGATLLEAGWEVVENTDAVIDRYREATIALDYYGDSIVNSVADMAAMLAGFGLAARLRAATVAALATAMEIALALTIRDNLTLNILMLLYPLDAVRQWQAG